MKNFLKNTIKFILLCLSILTTLWLLILLILYFSLSVSKIKNYTLNFFNQNTDIVLTIDDVSLKLFPNIELVYLNILGVDKVENKKIFKTDRLKINFSYLELLSGDLKIKVKLGKSSYFAKHEKLNFSNIAYTYATFLFLSKYKIDIDTLNIEEFSGSTIKLKVQAFIDPISQMGNTNSSIEFLGYNYFLKTKFKLSQLGIENFNFILTSKELINSKNLNLDGFVKRVDGVFVLNDLTLITGDAKLNFSYKKIALTEPFIFEFKTEEFSSGLIFTLFPDLNNYLENKASPFLIDGNVSITYTGFKFTSNILFTNPILGYKFKGIKASKLLVLFEKTEDTSKSDIEIYGERGNLLKRGYDGR